MQDGRSYGSLDLVFNVFCLFVNLKTRTGGCPGFKGVILFWKVSEEGIRSVQKSRGSRKNTEELREITVHQDISVLLGQ